MVDSAAERSTSTARRFAGLALYRTMLMVQLVTVPAAAGRAQGTMAPFQVTGGAIIAPLDGRVGDATRGRQLALDRAVGNCLICHRVPNEPGERFQGELGPDLAGVGSRLNAGEIRLRLVDQTRLNPATIMPPYHRADDLNRVGAEWRGKPALSAQQIEDIVAYLGTLS